jgi:6-phosphogluconolactonase
MLADAAARRIIGLVANTIARRGGCTLALAGGATPRPVYGCMAIAPLVDEVAWDRVTVYFGDERCVSPEAKESNYRMAREALLRHEPVRRATVHRMQGERADPDAAAQDYERRLPAALDLLLLGMGEDGHTASLFPRSPAVAERVRRVVAVTRPTPQRPRLTITPRVIDAASNVIVLLSGADKAATVAKALEGPHVPDRLPIQLALRGTWLMDDAAARELEGFEP